MERAKELGGCENPRSDREGPGGTPQAAGRCSFSWMLNELAKSGQVNAHNFQYETVALLARECESFVKGSDLVPEHLQHPLPSSQGALWPVRYGRGQGLYKYQNQTLIEQLEITPDGRTPHLVDPQAPTSRSDLYSVRIDSIPPTLTLHI